MYRVLALDGGGIRGLLTATLLRRLCSEHHLEALFDSVDLIAGTSSGGLIALAMGHGLGCATMTETLEKTCGLFARGRETFGASLPWLLGGTLLWPKYRTAPRRRAIQALVGDATLGTLRKHVLIAAFDLDNTVPAGSGGTPGRRWKPKLFHNFPGPGSDRHEPVWKVALATTAAPAYFPPSGGYIDGGVYSNNPSMCALAQVFDERYEPRPKPPLGQIALFSVGSGQNLKFIEEEEPQWGAFRWGVKYVDLTMDGTVGIADYQCERLLGRNNYRRLQYEFEEGVHIGLDDLGMIGELERIADAVPLDACADWLRTRWVADPALA